MNYRINESRHKKLEFWKTFYEEKPGVFPVIANDVGLKQEVIYTRYYSNRGSIYATLFFF